MEEETGRPGMLWARSSFAGGQRHVAQWSADCECSFLGMMSSLRGGLSLGMCGHAFWGHDIGGFYVQPTPEVYIRWVELGMLSPLARAHGVTTRLPWDYGDEALRIFREYTRLRYRLLPYFYSYARVAADTSLPMMRPMVLEFPDDPCTYSLDLQFMLGEYLLVAPIFNSAGERSVYFPAGRWVDYWTHELIEGPGARHIHAPLDVLPLYVRSGALIPTIDPPDYITDEPFEKVVFDAYLTDPGTFALYDTDGFTRIAAAVKGSTLSVQIEGVKDWLGLRVLPLDGLPDIAGVEVNGEASPLVEQLAWQLDSPAGWAREADGTVRVLFRAGSGKGGNT
jgi:alpha-D-xyloside xylohydrolase